MGGLERRLARLEAATGSSGGGDGPPCPDCGWPHEGDHGPHDTYEVVFSDGSEGPTYCETCGEAIPEIVVTWGIPPNGAPRGWPITSTAALSRGKMHRRDKATREGDDGETR